jgi:glycosyltransferase involved in cell wall biosynthesis
MQFSVVIPAHNGELYLRLTIESALNQTRKADEIIVVDDASTDKTAEIAQSLEYRASVR